MTYTFTCLTTIENVAPDEVFDLCLDVELHVQSMARSRERVLEAPPGKLLGVGDRVTWSARHFGLPWRMTSEVTEWDRPTRFVDEQVSGPFQSFRHEHRFRADDGGAVEMVDVITMSAPLGLLGRLVEHVGLGRYMERLIQHRAEVIKAHAQGEVGRST